MTSGSRREFLKAGGLALAGVGIAPLFRARLLSLPAPKLIEMRSDALGSRVWFDPIGVYVQPGTTVRWILRENVHTTTAYHPTATAPSRTATDRSARADQRSAPRRSPA